MTHPLGFAPSPGKYQRTNAPVCGFITYRTAGTAQIKYVSRETIRVLTSHPAAAQASTSATSASGTHRPRSFTQTPLSPTSQSPTYAKAAVTCKSASAVNTHRKSDAAQFSSSPAQAVKVHPAAGAAVKVTADPRNVLPPEGTDAVSVPPTCGLSAYCTLAIRPVQT